MTGTPTSKQTEETAIASAIEVVDGSGTVLKRFKALPYGDPFFGRDGRGPYILRDKAQAEQVIAATRATLTGADMMVDYDHQGHYASEGAAIQAKAAGWINAIEAGDDGIYVTAEWTPPAEAALASREYRYVSPDFRVSKATREVTRLVRVSLTNSPNLELPALASRKDGGAPTGEDPDMKTILLNSVALAAALAIKADDLDEAKVLAAIETLKSGKDGAETALASVRKELELGEDADGEAVLASIQSAKKAGEPDPAKFVPKAGYDDLAGRLKSLEEDKVLAAVDQAVADGKVPPAMKDWAIALGKKDPAELHAYLDKAVPFQGGKPVVQGDGKPEKGKLSDEEKAICAQLGIGEAEFLKSRDSNEEAA